MQASSDSKSISIGSSSEDDLLDEVLGARKKHFLDYDYDIQQTTNAIAINKNANITQQSSDRPKIVNSDGNGSMQVPCGSMNTNATINNNNNNNNNNSHIELKKKFNDKPSSSKAPTMDRVISIENENVAAPSANLESVYAIISMLGNYNSSDITTKFLEFSKNREMCAALRRSGCISLLVQIIHSDPNDEVRKKASSALHNVVFSHPDDKSGRREARVMRLIEQLFEYCDSLRLILKNEILDNVDRHPIQAIGTLMKISFDEEHRYVMCQLGALQTISTLIQLDHSVHGPVSSDSNCITMRRYAGMCLTNLTFGDGNNKALLCSNKNFMRALVDQINSSSDELVQVTASVIRNLSWRADIDMKEVLNEIGTIKILSIAAMKCSMENTLKAILSALWNLSNHCAKNKSEFCEIDGAIEFLVDMLSYEAPSKTMAVIENAGGILRNISSHIATKEEYRAILRRKDCFNILLQQLKSPSLTVVSNACGTLGNLSAQCVEDQKFLRDNQAIPMLRSLIYSKHKMISTGSTIALRHLLGCKSNVNHNGNLDSVARMMDLKELPTLNVRKQRALEIELDKNLAGVEIDDLSPSTKDDKTKDFSESKDETEVNRDSEKYRRNEVQDIEDDVDNEDAPTNFSQKYDDDDNEQERREYQESNLDQITNYSLRYAENQYGVEDGDDEEDEEEAAATKRKQKKPENVLNADDITQYFTEGTPHTVLSGAGSMSELSLNEKVKQMKTNIADDKAKITAKSGIVGSKLAATQSGVQTPDNIVNYCVEGTPGDFSRNDSLSDLEESSLVGGQKSDKAGSSKQLASKQTVIPPPLDLKKDKEDQSEKDNIGGTSKSVTFVNLADETPMMFSRTSSMGSLSSAEPTCIDDKSSIVSEFSRFASGIISPSELPDSPTQSVPQSPRRIPPESQKVDNNPISRTPPIPTSSGTRVEEPTALRSVFEDNFNSFNIENTPAHFSYATSLSNLSFDDEPKISTDALSKDFCLMKHPSEDEEQKAKIAQEEPSFEQDVVNPTDTADQSDSESVNDNFLLESCINIGMNRNLTRVPPNGAENTNEASTASDDQILEDCIRDGMPKFSSCLIKENPLDMMRTGAPIMPPYLPVVDEFNRFIVEDSPCNFSVMSGLSAITIESNMNKAKAEAGGSKKPTNEPLNPPVKFGQRKTQDVDDSLSSLSIESEDDNLLSQAIAAGSNSIANFNKPMSQEGPSTNPINIPFKNRTNDLCNDSISSVDSCDSKKDDLLEQCIRSGINNGVKKESSSKLAEQRHMMTSSPKKSLLPTYSKPSASTSKILKSKEKVLEQKDEELLQECITTGILSNTRQDNHMANDFARMSININTTTTMDPESKNGLTTSVIVKENNVLNVSSKPHTVTDVGVEVVENQMKMSSTMLSKADYTYNNNCVNNYNNNSTYNSKEKIENRDRKENTVSKSDHSRQGIWTMPNGSNSGSGFDLSMTSIDDNLLERSNEYPALKLSSGAYDDEDSMNCMEVSNEFMMEAEKLSCDDTTVDKHKDPDLMMKSVERLTHELVTQAEYLRKNAMDDISEQQKITSNSNTWNDENSFPSISMSAPMIGSTNDEMTFATDQIPTMPEEINVGYPQQLDDKTPTNDDYCFVTSTKLENFTPTSFVDELEPKIDFKVGGEIHSQSQTISKLNYLNYGPTSIETCSTMSNSTIVMVEANKVANHLTTMASKMMDSTNSLDLENVRPPSSMDCISLNSYQDSAAQSPQFQNRLMKKSLLTGLVAKRALGHQMFCGSVESINSINNIDSIRPPSIMDELLDSMISVDSIVTEVFDPTMGISNYETALSDMEDSLTLRSCQDLTIDESVTPISSDFSSVESTPTKKKRNLRSVTPKQKRQSDRDRYKTYTIAYTMILKEQQQMEQQRTDDAAAAAKRGINARQRRQDDRQRFETQIISHSPEENCSPIRQLRRKEDPDRYRTQTIEIGKSISHQMEQDDDFSFKAMTDNFEFIRNGVVPSGTGLLDTSNIRSKLNRIRTSAGSSSSPGNNDDSMEYERQNSETESQRDLKNSLVYDGNSSLEKEEAIDVTPQNEATVVIPSSVEAPEIKVKTKNSYISPYRMTARLTPTKNKSVKVTKTPIIAKIVTRNPVVESKTPISLPKGVSKVLSAAKSSLSPRVVQSKVTPAKVATSIPTRTSAGTPTGEKAPEIPIVRQGTFIKDEPSIENVPIVDIPPSPAKMSKLKPPTKMISKIPSTDLQKQQPSPKKSSQLPTSVTNLMKYRSNSNASMKTKDVLTPIRSNTGINLQNPRKNITSRIAGLWKSTDKKDPTNSITKKTISTSSTQLTNGKIIAPLAVNGRRTMSKDKIKRSSTLNEIV